MAEPTKERQGMREIKFRAYRESTKSWVYGVFASRDSVLPPNTFHMSKFWELVEEGVLKWVCQFTGLCDKNGKEIYEGDIVAITVRHEDFIEGEISRTFKAKIDFQRGGFWFTGIDYYLTDTNWHFYNDSDFEVIGNIYENPELLEALK